MSVPEALEGKNWVCQAPHMKPSKTAVLLEAALRAITDADADALRGARAR